MCEQNDKTNCVPGNFNDTIAIQNTQVLYTLHLILLWWKGTAQVVGTLCIRHQKVMVNRKSQLLHSPQRK